MRESVWDIFNHGGYAMYLIVGSSVLAVAVGLERAWVEFAFTQKARALAEVVGKCLTRGAIDDARSASERSRSPLADVFLVGYARLGRHKPEHVVTAVHRERIRVGQALRARLWILGTIGATAPFVGLFGTVFGIMDAMSELKGDVTLETVSGPISSALIVTAAGIIVAVGAVVLFNYFSQRAAAMATEVKLLTDEFLELLLEAAPDAPADKPRKRADAKEAKDGKDATDGEGATHGDREAA